MQANFYDKCLTSVGFSGAYNTYFEVLHKQQAQGTKIAIISSSGMLFYKRNFANFKVVDKYTYCLC